ncbi:MAG: N-acetyltransferase [Myxococcales bacterium]|nr:N-acetyltransferase [Myxococcales bacterium]
MGDGTRVWHQVQIRERASLGRNCIIGKGTYIDFDVQIGDNVKIQNGCFVYHGCTLEDGVFVGPGVIFTNDKFPRAINPDGSLKTDSDWQVGPTRVCYGASIGAGAIVLPDVTIGRFAVVGSGAVVSKNVVDYGIVQGVPARLVGFACVCGQKLVGATADRHTACPACARGYTIAAGQCTPFA